MAARIPAHRRKRDPLRRAILAPRITPRRAAREPEPDDGPALPAPTDPVDDPDEEAAE